MTNALSDTFNAELGRTQFLEMFVAQVQHQDPLSPMDQTQILGQLAHFSQVEGMETLNQNFDTFLKRELASTTALVDASAALLDKNVTFGAGENGVVDSVKKENGQVLVEVDGQLIPITDVDSISN